MAHPIPVYQVDAFASHAFAGNPAAVCLLEQPRDAAWMQLVAREMNLSETAFLVPSGDVWSLRWFTPTVEVELCGHATLASAHVLWESGRLPSPDTARFDTASGRLQAARSSDWIALDFPATPDRPVAPPAGLAEALGAAPRYVGTSSFDLLVELDDEATARLRLLEARGVMVTSAADTPGYDFVSRFFGPAVGVDEDPVTGSAHCCLGPYWSRRLGRSRLVAWQASARGGHVEVELRGDRVVLYGKAVTVLEGRLTDAAAGEPVPA